MAEGASSNAETKQLIDSISFLIDSIMARLAHRPNLTEQGIVHRSGAT
jgi:hypothetical protein